MPLDADAAPARCRRGRSGCWRNARADAMASACSAPRCAAIRASPRWSSITPCSMTICAIPSRCCGRRRPADAARRATGPMRGRHDRPTVDAAERRRLYRPDVGLAGADRRGHSRRLRFHAGIARLLDIGGGDGAFLLAAAGRCARRCGFTLFDLPPVAEMARDPLRARPDLAGAPTAFERQFPRRCRCRRGRSGHAGPHHPRP